MFDFLVEFTWFRGEGTEGPQLSSSPQFERTALSDQGVYTCEVNIRQIGFVTERIINFQVVGKHTIILFASIIIFCGILHIIMLY